MGYLIGHHNPLTSFPHFVKSCRTTWVLAVTLPGSNYWWMSQWVKYGLRSKVSTISKCQCLRWPHTQLRQMKNSSSQQAKPILQSSSLANRCLRSSRIQLIQAGRIQYDDITAPSPSEEAGTRRKVRKSPVYELTPRRFFPLSCRRGLTNSIFAESVQTFPIAACNVISLVWLSWLCVCVRHIMN